jgi:hypothetical protein
MKKVTTLIVLSLFIVLQGWTQKSYEMEVHNLVQLNETEFTFDIRMKNTNPSEPFAIETIQWQLSLDDFRNGGILDNAFLTYVDNTTGLVGEIIPESGEFSTNASNNVLQWISSILLDGAQTTFFGDGDWKNIGTFKLQLRNAANTGFLNFADMHHGLDFITNQVLVFHCNYTESGGEYFRDGAFAEEITTKTVTNNLLDRQLAGYWFEGDGDWNNTSLWNNVTVENTNTLPDGNSNAIINGNVTIPDGLDVSLLPDGNGNGGEVTVLTGEEPLYTLSVAGNDPDVNVRIYDVASASYILNWTASGSVDLTAGTVVHLQTQYDGFGFGTFDNWTDQNSTILGTNTNLLNYVMPSENMDITANWSISKSSGSNLNNNLLEVIDFNNIDLEFEKGISDFKNGSKSLYAGLTIVPSASLTVDKLFNDNENGAEAILVKSDENGTGYLIHNNAGVLATVERYLTKDVYHFISSPIADIDYSLLQVDPFNLGPYSYADFFEWVEADMEWINLNYAENSGDPLPVGTLDVAKGYALAYGNVTETKSFAGEVNVGTFSFTATYTPGDDYPYWNEKGQNLIGNPYPAALDAEMFVNANTSLYGLYFWDEDDNYIGNRDDYATWTTAGGVAGGKERHKPDGYIAPGQGFMAKVISSPVSVPANVTLYFEDDMRTVTPTYFYKASQDRDRLWLSVTGPQDDYNEILVAFMEGAEEGMDRTDAEKLKGNSKIAFYSMLEDGDFVIQGLPVLLQTDTYEIPLGLDAGITGQYTFNLEEIENFDPNTDITFEDRLTGEIIDLKTTPQYVVHIDVPGDDPVVINDRFFLHFNGPTSVPVIGNQKLTNVYAVNNQIIISHTGNSNILDVEVINTLGQLVVQTPVNATETTITVPGRNLVYIVKIRTDEGVESHKLLIR